MLLSAIIARISYELCCFHAFNKVFLLERKSLNFCVPVFCDHRVAVI